MVFGKLILRNECYWWGINGCVGWFLVVRFYVVSVNGGALWVA